MSGGSGLGEHAWGDAEARKVQTIMQREVRNRQKEKRKEGKANSRRSGERSGDGIHPGQGNGATGYLLRGVKRRESRPLTNQAGGDSQRLAGPCGTASNHEGGSMDDTWCRVSVRSSMKTTGRYVLCMDGGPGPGADGEPGDDLRCFAPPSQTSAGRSPLQPWPGPPRPRVTRYERASSSSSSSNSNSSVESTARHSVRLCTMYYVL